MSAIKNEAKLVEVHGEKLFTTSSIIAKSCGVTHKAVIQLVRKFKNDLHDVGRVAFQMRPFETKGGIQEQEIAVLDDYASMLLLTHMRSNEVVRKFKLELVREFKRMAKMLTEPGRKQELQHKRDTGREMTDTLKFLMEHDGKTINPHHFSNEHIFCNHALTGKWESLDEANLDVYDTRLLTAIRKYNQLLIARHLKQGDRKEAMDKFVAEYRVKHPRLMLVSNGDK